VKSGLVAPEKAMRVEELMTQPVKTCLHTDSLNQAARVMWEDDCKCLTVVDSDGRAVGILTDRDIAMAAYTQGRVLAEMGVALAMTKQLHCCLDSDFIEEAERMMAEHKVRRLPVLDQDRRPVGILSSADIAFARAQVPLGQEVS